MGNALTLIGSSLVRIAYVALFVVFAATPAVSVAFGDTGASRHVASQGVDEAAPSSAMHAASDASASAQNAPQVAFSNERALHPCSTSIAAIPGAKIVVPHGLAPDRPEASVPETANPNIPRQNVLAPGAVEPITPEPDDLVANGLAPPAPASLYAISDVHAAIDPDGAAGCCARQDALTGAAALTKTIQHDAVLNTPVGNSGTTPRSAAPRLEAGAPAGLLTTPCTAASTRGALNPHPPHKAGSSDFNLLRSETPTSGEVVAP